MKIRYCIQLVYIVYCYILLKLDYAQVLSIVYCASPINFLLIKKLIKNMALSEQKLYF